MIRAILRIRDAYRRIRGWHSDADIERLWDVLTTAGLRYRAVSACIDAARRGATVHPVPDAGVILFGVPRRCEVGLRAAGFRPSELDPEVWSLLPRDEPV